MSDVVDQPGQTGEPVSPDDLRHMLDEARGRAATLERELTTERSNRIATEHDRDTERTARIVTEQDRDTHAARATSEAERRYNAEKEAVKGGMEAQEALARTAEDAYARHAEAGDWKEAGRAQRQIAEATARLTNLRGQHDYLENNKERLVPPVAAPRREAPRPSGDRISELVGGQLAPGEREWLQQRPKFLDDSSYRGQVFGASQVANSRGLARGSEAYFREMEKILGEGADTRAADPTPVQRGQSSDMTPQRRVSPGAAPTGGREVKLTADQAEIADGMYGQPNSDNYLPNPADRYQKYYDNMERMRAAGRMT